MYVPFNFLGEKASVTVKGLLTKVIEKTDKNGNPFLDLMISVPNYDLICEFDDEEISPTREITARIFSPNSRDSEYVFSRKKELLTIKDAF